MLEELEIDKPAFSRLWSALPDGLVLGAGRTRQYALRRAVQGVDSPIPVFRVCAQGHIEPVGSLTPLQGGFYVLTPGEGNRFQIFEGLPWFIADLRPQGFLGRLEPGKHPELDLPSDILSWSDERVLAYVSRRSEHAPGDLVLGNESLARYRASMAGMQELVTPASERRVVYPDLADRVMQGNPPGSTAGGEQPKFTATVCRDDYSNQGNHGDDRQMLEHVIVKFSPPLLSASGRRWGDLLVCEHLALEVLARHGIAAARTAIVEAGTRRFLEVVRFDRAGWQGRHPVVTSFALDGDIGMLDKSWSEFARELGRRGELAEQDVHTVEILDLFGALIGNSDRHHGNMAVAWTLERRFQLLEAYDMLPMRYRLNAHGEIVVRPWTHALAQDLELRHLPMCHAMAMQFWSDVLADVRISSGFKQEVVLPHVEILRSLQPG